MIEFYYQEEYSDKFGPILRPLAPILLTNTAKSDKFILVTMYIDPGADVTMIPLKAGEVLGFSYNTKKIFQMHGIAGSLPCILEEAQIKIGERKFTADITWALSDDAPFLLGRRHIFEHFKITFDERKRRIFFI
jgi:hypothetical protein